MMNFLSSTKRLLLPAIERLSLVVMKLQDRDRLQQTLALQTAESDRLQQVLALQTAETERLQQVLALQKAETDRLQQVLALQTAETDRLQQVLALQTAETAETERLQQVLALQTAEKDRLQQKKEELLWKLGRLHQDMEVERQNAREEILRLKVEAEQTYDYQLLMEYQAKLFAFKDREPTFHALYERVRSCTMTSVEKLYAMYRATEYVLKAGVPGDIVECGVWRGGSMMMAALSALALGDASRRLVLFDTFEGHPAPDQEKDGPSVYSEWKSRRRSDQSSDWARASLDDVRRNLESTGYPMNKVSFVKGMVQDTMPANAPETIALLRLDTDWYESTAWELKHLYPHLSERGVLIIDDYGTMLGQQRATDEYFADNGEVPLFNRVDFAGRLAVKPAAGFSHEGLARTY
jgi:O-methyltransferase